MSGAPGRADHWEEPALIEEKPSRRVELHCPKCDNKVTVLGQSTRAWCTRHLRTDVEMVRR